MYNEWKQMTNCWYDELSLPHRLKLSHHLKYTGHSQYKIYTVNVIRSKKKGYIMAEWGWGRGGGLVWIHPPKNTIFWCFCLSDKKPSCDVILTGSLWIPTAAHRLFHGTPGPPRPFCTRHYVVKTTTTALQPSSSSSLTIVTSSTWTPHHNAGLLYTCTGCAYASFLTAVCECRSCYLPTYLTFQPKWPQSPWSPWSWYTRQQRLCIATCCCCCL